MSTAQMQELKEKEFVVIYDGYTQSKKWLSYFEEKYNRSSFDVFKRYYEYSDIISFIPDEDIKEWIFHCNRFLSCGGILGNKKRTI